MFEGIDEIFAAGKKDLMSVEGIDGEVAERLSRHDTEKARAILKKTYNSGAFILTDSDPTFPSALRECIDRPYVLYAKGERLNWDRHFCIGIVGTRKYTDYGKQITERIAYDLAQNGVTTVSGLANGIDSFAHRASIEAGAKTFAFLGCGIDIVYPASNRALYKAVEQNGTIFTEFPPETPPVGGNFLVRNRLIAAISRGVLIAEAPARSGALNTARWANDMGKDVFAVPGDYDRSNSEGCNAILKESYAYLAESAEDILLQYPDELGKIWENGHKIRKGPIEKKGTEIKTEKKISIDDERFASLDEDSKKVISLLIEKNMNFDEICIKSGIDAAKLTSMLMFLELGGYVDKMPGNNFSVRI